eukprot:TRINITY_DN22581_c0_g1_i1.p1 TRINITY_DN22581_c0_g1~~TRINITY_DN22581_c0_g1_i1.p1  ORF type:complete len:138 (+),score=45.62 TRINITY_DN22581_c0_g1_i1:60-473(+)
MAETDARIVMLGPVFEDAPTVITADAAMILETRKAALSQGDDDAELPLHTKKALEYASRLKKFKTPEAVDEALATIEQFREDHNLSAFEVTLIADLLPQTKDEACQVMPTLEEHVSNEVVKPETLDELLHSLHGFVQ